MLNLFCSFLILFFLNPFKVYAATGLTTGTWRFVLKQTYAEIPFMVEIIEQNGSYLGSLKNGEETIALKDLSIKDNILSIPLQAYEISLEMNLSGPKMMSGYLVRHNKNPVTKTPVEAYWGEKKRFLVSNKIKASVNLSGKWGLELLDESGKKSPAIGIFKQQKNRFQGSILTTTGDYRFIEGYVHGSTFEGASFDGVYNYVFRGQIKNSLMEASILSSSSTLVKGQLSATAELPDAYKQTEINEVKFIFPDLKGQNVNLSHEKFKQKPVVIQIFGSWCPNCIDEMNYLIPWYKENSPRGIEVVALAFERSLGPEEATRQLLKVRDKFNVPYPILKAGSTSEDKPSEILPGLKNFISFPTTIFLNRKHQVVKVHAGFSGPGTGEFFEKWKKEFNQTVDELLK